MGERNATNDYARCRWPTCNCYAPGAPQNCIRDEARRQYQSFVERCNRITDREIEEAERRRASLRQGEPG